jgi:hypothetical protein
MGTIMVITDIMGTTVTTVTTVTATTVTTTISFNDWDKSK